MGTEVPMLDSHLLKKPVDGKGIYTSVIVTISVGLAHLRILHCPL